MMWRSSGHILHELLAKYMIIHTDPQRRWILEGACCESAMPVWISQWREKLTRTIVCVPTRHAHKILDLTGHTYGKHNNGDENANTDLADENDDGEILTTLLRNGTQRCLHVVQ